MAPMQAILEFGQFVYQDKDNQDDAVMKSLVSLLGDLASNVSNLGPFFQQKPYVYQILEEAQRSPDPSVAEAAGWAYGVIVKSVNGAQ